MDPLAQYRFSQAYELAHRIETIAIRRGHLRTFYRVQDTRNDIAFSSLLLKEWCHNG